MNMLKQILIPLFVLVLPACSTPYQPYGFGGGYKEEKVSDGKYKLLFSGNGLTSNEQVKELWHRRASELCPNGYSQSNMNDEPFRGFSMVYTGGVLVPIGGQFPELVG
ncbi:CC0125/CC1285 family lipoprotein [Microbulbifer sp. ANSA005]|uniref:CC0125/CC1285 family lipoprotein n=1 Tax=Microbulbifer sp. ANSA005 TaxID=3243362 RepID=UPI00404367B8